MTYAETSLSVALEMASERLHSLESARRDIEQSVRSRRMLRTDHRPRRLHQNVFSAAVRSVRRMSGYLGRPHDPHYPASEIAEIDRLNAENSVLGRKIGELYRALAAVPLQKHPMHPGVSRKSNLDILARVRACPGLCEGIDGFRFPEDISNADDCIYVEAIEYVINNPKEQQQ